jgi:hypothetical protein
MHNTVHRSLVPHIKSAASTASGNYRSFWGVRLLSCVGFEKLELGVKEENFSRPKALHARTSTINQLVLASGHGRSVHPNTE